MGRWGITKPVALWLLLSGSSLSAGEFKHVGDFLLQSHYKLNGDRKTPIPMKSLAFHVYTDGVKVRVTAEGNEEAHTTFDIYRSDGIGRQRPDNGALEVIPGIQAMSRVDGVLRHLRLSGETMTITTFPGVSDQTIVSHSVAAAPRATAVANPTPAKP